VFLCGVQITVFWGIVIYSWRLVILDNKGNLNAVSGGWGSDFSVAYTKLAMSPEIIKVHQVALVTLT